MGFWLDMGFLRAGSTLEGGEDASGSAFPKAQATSSPQVGKVGCLWAEVVGEIFRHARRVDKRAVDIKSQGDAHIVQRLFSAGRDPVPNVFSGLSDSASCKCEITASQ
jgi:hypothetical protein